MSFAEIDWGALLQAAYVSAAFGIGVLAVAGFAVVASLKAQDRRESGQSGVQALNAVTGISVVIIGAAIVLGIFIMTNK
jgi:fucose permease